MELYSFNKNRNNFLVTENIESVLLYGNPNCIFDEQITICIPTYKRATLLSDAIKSALQQKNIKNPYKIIVVDNNDDFSDNDNLNLIQSFSAKNICYYKNKKNIQMFGNLNRCVFLAKTEWVALLHDDDLLNENYLFEIEKLILNNNIDCFCTPVENIGNYPGKKAVFPSSLFQKINYNLKQKLFNKKIIKFSISANIFGKNIYGPPTCGIVFKRNSFLKSGGFNQDYFPSADWYFMIYFNRNFKIRRYNKILSKYRWAENCSLKPETKQLFLQQKKYCLENLQHVNILTNLLYLILRKDLLLCIKTDNNCKTNFIYKKLKSLFMYKYL